MRRSYYRKTSQNVERYDCECSECNEGFRATRPDAVYCSNACKCKAAYRRRVAGILAEATVLGIRTAHRELKKIQQDVAKKKLEKASFTQKKPKK